MSHHGSDIHSSFLSSIGNNGGQAVVAVSINDDNPTIGSYSVLNTGSVNLGGGGGITETVITPISCACCWHNAR